MKSSRSEKTTFRNQTIVQRAIKVVCGLLLSVSVSSVGASIMLLNEAADDGWQITEFTNLASLLREFAPFGLFPLVTGALVGFCFFATTKDSTLRFFDLMLSSISFVISFTILAVASQVVWGQLYLDGWLEGTVSAWIFHTVIAAGLLIVGVYSLKPK